MIPRPSTTGAPERTDRRPSRRRTADVWALLGGVAVLAVTWVAALADSVSSLEESVFRYFNEWPDWLENPSWPIMQLGAVAAVPTVAVLVYLIWRRRRLAIGLLVAGMTAWLLAKVVKELVQRGRPEDLLDDVILRPAWTGLGFVSGHATTAFALITVAWSYLTRRWRVVVLVGGVATAVLRMYTAAHLPLDVIGGAGLGVAVGALVNLVLGTAERRAQETDWTPHPLPEPSGGPLDPGSSPTQRGRAE